MTGAGRLLPGLALLLAVPAFGETAPPWPAGLYNGKPQRLRRATKPFGLAVAKSGKD